MKTTAVRSLGVNDLRLEEFELPPIKDDDILAHILSPTACACPHICCIHSGAKHTKRTSQMMWQENPIIIGHEFCGDAYFEVGAKWKDQSSSPRR